MPRRKTAVLTPRQAQILQALWSEGPLTVAQIRDQLPNAPTTNTIRKLLSIMLQRRLVDDDGRDYGKRYRACANQARMRKDALNQLVQIFYKNGAGDLLEDLQEMGELQRTKGIGFRAS